MFSGFDNVFSRLTDYYFQFLILYLPMMFYPERDISLDGKNQIRRIALSQGQRVVALLFVALLAFFYYYQTNLSAKIDYEADNYLNYRFCWEVQE